MANILKFSDAASLGLHAMVILAETPDKLVTVRESAKGLYVSEAHLSKVLQRLARQGLVDSVRGPGGGFRLKRDPADINLLEVYEAIDGKLVDNECLIGMSTCPREKCIMGDLMVSVNSQIREYLTGTSLADLVVAGKRGELCYAKSSE